MEDTKKAGASYILTFYSEIQTLKHNYAVYENRLIEFKEKYKSDLSQAPEEYKQQIIQEVQNVRYICSMAFISYQSIIKATDKKVSKGIEENYQAIRNNFVIKAENLQAFVIALNEALLNDVIQKLLNNSQELVTDIYGDNSKQ